MKQGGVVEPSRPGGQVDGPELGDPRFLVVDDCPQTCELFADLLREMGYSRITLAFDGQAAIAAVEAEGSAIDVILLNLVMPRLNGLRVVEHLATTYDRVIGIVMITGQACQVFAEEFFARGTDTVLTVDMLPKPITTAEIRFATSRALELVQARRLDQRVFVASEIAKQRQAAEARLPRIPPFAEYQQQQSSRTTLLGQAVGWLAKTIRNLR